MEKYIQINNLDEATENETVCACYPCPTKNVSGRKHEECILRAEQEAREGKCKLLVWRKIEEPLKEQDYVLTSRDVDQIIVKYNNAKIAMREYQEQNNPEYKIEYGKALAFEGILAMLGFDTEEVRRKYWIGKDERN